MYETQITIALLVATMTAIGWAVTHYFASKRDRAQERVAAQLRYVERQIEELYGPLASLMYENRQDIRDVFGLLQKEEIFPLEGHDLEIWLFVCERSLMPRNEKIRNLIAQKTHLIDEPQFPESFTQFLEHHHSWNTRHLMWKEKGMSYNWRSPVRWPKRFDEEIINKFESLKAKHARLIGLLNESPSSTEYN